MPRGIKQTASGSTNSQTKTTVTAQHWKRPDLIACDKDPRKEYRLVSPEKVAYWKSQGMIVDNAGSMKAQEFMSMAAGTSGYRSMILMSWPKNMGQERKEYYIGEQKKAMKAVVYAANVSTQARKLSAGSDEDKYGRDRVGTIGNVIIRDELKNQKGHSFNKTKTYKPEDVDPAEAAKLAERRAGQAEETKRREGGEPETEE